MHTRSTIVLWAIVLVILLQALSVQMLSAMNGDVAFLFSMAKHTGLQEFYLQYYEVNPPLIVYLYKLFLLPSLLGINELASANTSMILYILLCLVLSYHYLSHLSHFARFSLTLAFTIGLVAVSEIMFLQREHIIAAGLIVYVAHALNSENNAKTRVWWEAISAIIVTISFALKPQYIVVLLLVEVTFMIRRRTFYIRPLMYWIVVLGLSYLFLIITFQRSYVDFILPLASEYYAGYFTEMTPLLTMVAIALLAIAAPYRLLLLGRVDKGIVSVLYVSTLGCLSAYVIGRTGFGYHMIPSLVFCVTIVVMSFLVGVRQLGNKHRIITLFYLLVVSATFYFLSGHYFFRTMDTRYEQAWHNWQSQTFPGINRSTLVEHSKIVSLTSFVEPYVLPGDGIIFFAQRMYPHGVIVHSEMIWASKLPNFWLLPVALSNPNDPRSSQVVEMVQETMATDIQRNQPRIIVVEISDTTNTYMPDFEFLPFFLSFDTFKKQFMNYDRVGVLETTQASFEIYVRK